MIYLFLQTWAWVLGAFILGLFFGWWLCGRCCCNDDKSDSSEGVSSAATAVTAASAVAPVAKAQAKAKLKKKAAVNEVVDVEDDWKPQGFASKPGDADDLKRIKGVGPVIEKTLNSLGIYQFKQIADFTADNISWVDNHISFPGRIQREEWVPQAKKLAAGKETEFSKKVDKGQAGY